MKVVHLVKTDLGGAGIAARRLSDSLRSLGVDSQVLCRSKQTSDPFVHVIGDSARPSLLSLIRRKCLSREIQNVGGSYEAFSNPFHGVNLEHCPQIEAADIVNLHWISGLVDYRSFFKKCSKPLVWTIHDMNPFMGGLHYSLDLDRNLTNQKFIALEEKIRSYKIKETQEARDLRLVFLCEWMRSKASKCSEFNRLPCRIIHNSINMKEYSSLSQQDARQQLDIAPEANVILIIAEKLLNYRKGMQLLLEALDQKLIRPDIEIVSIGTGDMRVNSGYPVKNLGRIDELERLATVYAAADCMVLPSLEDNLPNTMLESLAMGTPVIANENGGMREIIQDGVNGYIATGATAVSLAEKINLFFGNKSAFDSQAIRRNAEEAFDSKLQAQRYLDLYQGMLEQETL